MKPNQSIFTLLAILALPTLAFAQPVVVADSDFETPSVSILGLGGLEQFDATAHLDGSSGPTATGWYASQGAVTLVNQGIFTIVSPLTGDGSTQYLVLNSSPLSITPLNSGSLGGVSQVISTTPGQTYQVSFQTGSLNLNVGAPSTLLSAQVDEAPPAGGPNATLLSVDIGTFGNQSFTFTANSTKSTLDFKESTDLIGSVGGVALDNVSVTPVPEPRGYAALFLVFGIAIMMVRKLTGQTAHV